MTTKKDILKSLEKMGVPKDKAVTVHTSLRAIGKMENGGKTLLDALIEHCTSEGGLLSVPTHTWGYMDDPNVPTLDLCDPKSNLGAFPNIALQDKRGVRSLHPTHSMVVFGNKNKVLDFVKCDEKVDTMSSPDGCYGELYRQDGYVLLIGVGQNKNTFLHCVEEMLMIKNRIAKEKIMLTIKHKDGHIESRGIYPFFAEGIEDVSQQFPNYEAPFRYHHCIVDGKIGNADVQLCSTKEMAKVVSMIYERSDGQEMLAKAIDIDECYYK